MGKMREGESQKREDAGARKGGLAKAAGAEPAGQMQDEKSHAVVAQRTVKGDKRN